jgi:hypothetical protein
MPWSTGKDAVRHTKKANTPKKRRQWLYVANSALQRTGDDGLAIREANAVVGRNKVRGKNSEAHAYNWRSHQGRPRKRK